MQETSNVVTICTTSLKIRLLLFAAGHALFLPPLLEPHLDVEGDLGGGGKVSGLDEEVRVTDAGHDGREPEEERHPGQHVEGDDEHDGELVRPLVAELWRALEAKPDLTLCNLCPIHEPKFCCKTFPILKEVQI